VRTQVRESTGTRSVPNHEHGFSLIEMTLVVAIIMVISAIAFIHIMPASQDANCDSAMRQVIVQLRQAREYSIANRRYVQVTFPVVAGMPEVVITQRNTLTAGGGAVDTVLSTVPIHAPESFLVFNTLADTPDGYGNGAAIVFQGVSGGPVGGMLFQSDGELVSGTTFLPINGTVFLGLAGQTSTARAVTVLGGTGRVRGWKISGTTWMEF